MQRNDLFDSRLDEGKKRGLADSRMMVTKRFLITGCGRSGTGYTAKLLGDLGLPCGHETIFNPLNIERAQFVGPAHLLGESSWLAAPFLNSLPRGTVVLHQVREPVSVIRSYLRIRFFDEPTAYLQFAQEYVPDLAHGDRVERCMKYWMLWNRLAESGAEVNGLQYLRYRLEDIDAALIARIFELIGYPCPPKRVAQAVSKRPRDYNTRGDKNADAGVSWNTLPAGILRDALAAQAARYGYQGTMDDGTLAVTPRVAAR